MIANLRTLWQKLHPAWRASLSAFFFVRVLVLLLAILVVAVYPGTLDAQAEFREYTGFPKIEGPVRNVLWGVWLRGDTLWYMWYARDGLLPAAHPDYRAFWPLYPWLMRLIAPVFAKDYLVTGLVISNVALVLALVLFYRLVEKECDADVARRGMWYMLLFPSAIFFFAAYTESLFLLFSLAAFLTARQGRWVWACVWVALATLLRVSGAFLAPALGIEYLRQQMGSRGWQAWRDVGWWRHTVFGAWPFAIVVAAVAFVPVYTALFLDGNLMTVFTFHVEDAVGGGGTVFPWQSLIEAAQDLSTGDFFIIQPFDLAATLLFVVLTVVVLIRFPIAYGLYMVVTMLSLTSRSIPQQPLIGGARYVLTLFPAFMFFGQVGQRSWWNRLIAYPSLILLGFFAVQFMIGGFVG